MRVRRSLAILALTMLLGGCTDSAPTDSEATRTPARGFPKPKEPITSTVEKIKEASTDASCVKLAALIHPYLKPSDPARQHEQCMGFLPLMKGFEAVGSKAYGTGAVIDYKFDDQGRGRIQALLLALDKDRTFKLFALEGEFTAPTTSSVAKNIKGFDSTARSAVAAIRKGDCDRLYKITHSGLAPGAQDKTEFCGQYAGSGFQRALEADPDAETIRMGANGTYGFYALEVGPDRYYTVVIAAQEAKPRFVSEVRM